MMAGSQPHHSGIEIPDIAVLFLTNTASQPHHSGIEIRKTSLKYAARYAPNRTIVELKLAQKILVLHHV